MHVMNAVFGLEMTSFSQTKRQFPVCYI